MFVQYFTIPNKKNLDLRKKLDPSCICNNIEIFGVDDFDINTPYDIAFFTMNDDLESEKFRSRFYWKKELHNFINKIRCKRNHNKKKNFFNRKICNIYID